MKLPCSVIEDLLPLYHDQVCSAQSRELVEEHLTACVACRELLAQIGEELRQPANTAEETGPLRAIQAAWRQSRHKAFVKGTLVAAFCCMVLAGVLLALTQWKIIPVAPEKIVVSEVCQLQDGAIAFHLWIDDDRELQFIKVTTTDDGAFYMTPMRSVLEGRRQSDKGLYNRFFLLRLPQGQTAGEKQPQGDLLPEGISAIYLGPVGEGVLIWKEGMKLPEADFSTLAELIAEGV